MNEERKQKILTSTRLSRDAINQSQPAPAKANAFCYFFIPEQSHINSHSISVSLSKQNYSLVNNRLNKIKVFTRNKPYIDTSDIPKVKRKRMPTIPIVMNPINPQPQISVATQTDIQPPVSNVGQGRSPIDENNMPPLQV